MTIVLGEIESLKRLKSELKRNGIERFDSVGSIEAFRKSYQEERRGINEQVEKEIEKELSQLQDQLETSNEILQTYKKAEKQRIERELAAIAERIKKLQNVPRKKRTNMYRYTLVIILSFWDAIYWFFSNLRLRWNVWLLTKKFQSKENKLNHFIENKDKETKNRSGHLARELERTKQVVDKLYPQIAGAIGENKVVKELQNLSDENILINDFSFSFDPPLYRKETNEYIKSVQIDHLLVNRAGVFILETKNWSKASVQNLDLRSPVDQVLRSGYALYTVLNGKRRKGSFWLKKHHWGDRKVPIRNVIVMTGHKPKETFNYVQVKRLNELNDYIKYFEPMFTPNEANEISVYLERLNFGRWKKDKLQIK